EAIRPYMPDLSARDAYVKQRDSDPFRSAIYQVIEKLNPYNPVAAPHINMRHTFPIEPDKFVTAVNGELGKAARYVVYLDEREKEMEKLQKMRDAEPNPRWRANYDLIYAQIVAYKVRMYEYGAYLQDFMKN